MNFHNPDLDPVEQSRPHSQSRHLLPSALPNASLSQSPTPSDLYVPDGIFGPPTVARAYGRPVIIEGPYRRVPDIPPLPQSQPSDWEASQNPAMMTEFRDELARLDGVITPGVDDTPFIQYAIEALSRDRDTGYSGVPTPSSGSSGPPAYVPGPHYQQYRYQQLGRGEQYTSAPASLPVRPPTAEVTQPATSRPQQPQRPFVPNARESAHSLAESLLKSGQRGALSHEWVPVEREEILAKVGEARGTGVPPLNFRPWPLRAPALFAFMAMCVLMIAALILSAIYSHLHNGLVMWRSIHGGRYFVFRMLPQLIAAVMLLYAQFLATTMFRILPFARLASKLREEREGALFQDLYTSFLRPQLVGPWNVWVPILVTWLMNFTIPLQSSLFTVILVDQTWYWATVQGVAWTLVALYLALLVSTVIVWRYWATLETTGLIWDPRSLADIAALVSETNTADDYRATQLARSREGIRFALRRRVGDRLGYWTWKDGRPGFWHALGSPMDDANFMPISDLAAGQRMERHDEKKDGVAVTAAETTGLFGGAPDHDVEAAPGQSLFTQARHRYLPWCLRNNQLLWFTVTAFILVLAIFVASFLPATRITAGFIPGLKADPQPGAFSAADFLYSFVPSLLGMIIFLAFQSLDLHQRILQPWASLSDPKGSPAGQSLLADYPACAPLQVTLHALKNRHWRVAAISLLSTLFVLIPVLAGGVFMALTTRATSTGDAQVRMFPNRPGYYFLLALLVLYLVALVSLFPGRKAMRMPHGVTCLAEVIGFLVVGVAGAGEGLHARDDTEWEGGAFFKRCLGREEMLRRLGAGMGMAVEMQTKWVFGFGEEMGGSSALAGGADGGGELGVRRLRLFTEKRRVRKSQIKRRGFVGW
ncbi:Phosphoribosylaminoimidazole-succinocarboxamide synthase [Madurella fahalii]|uniref:Phosphoribosylaminoimidazole-succinocarboxamide synthase n=1 Tax=Madurella fahalii TaxID=1157608 RepID=A0ABQ0G1S6_9PEZI